MPPGFETAQFHASTGPASLFERVRFVMQAKRELKVHAKHLQERLFHRNAPIEKLRLYDPNSWGLMTVEVRKDTGRFVNFEKCCRGQGVVGCNPGLHDTIETIIDADNRKRGYGEAIVKRGKLYDFVAEVNRRLMAQSAGWSVQRTPQGKVLSQF